MSSRRYARWYLVHRWTSLICTLSLLLLCLTGLPLILQEEIGVWSGSTVKPPDLPGAATRVPIDRLVADALARRPGDAVRYASQSDDSPAWYVALGKRADATDATAVYKYDARTGAMLRDVPQSGGVMLTLRRLHVDLFAGLPGTLFIGVMGVLFLVSLVSGVVVYGVLMRGQPFGMVRARRSTRIRWLDLHNLLGIAALAWLAVVGLTGAINTLALPMLNHWQSTELAALITHWRGAAPAAAGSVQTAIDAARAAAPDMDVAFVGFPGSRFATPGHFMVFMRGDTTLTSRLLEPIMVDAASGRVQQAVGLPWYLKALLLSQPLHFGDYGGMPMKLLWIALDLVAIIVLGSGVYLWWARRESVRARLHALHGTGAGR